MTNILKSDMCGHQAARELCRILSDPSNKYAVNLLRGAVFFLGTFFFRISCFGGCPKLTCIQQECRVGVATRCPHCTSPGQ